MYTLHHWRGKVSIFSENMQDLGSECRRYYLYPKHEPTCFKLMVSHTEMQLAISLLIKQGVICTRIVSLQQFPYNAILIKMAH